jgi:hypothetical protein
MSRRWQQAMRDRFADREDVGRDAAYASFFAPHGLSMQAVFEFFDFVEQEFGISGGQLRPGDSVGMLLEPLPASNLLASLTNEVRAGDRELALQLILAERWTKIRGRDPQPLVSSIGDMVRVWCGVS